MDHAGDMTLFVGFLWERMRFESTGSERPPGERHIRPVLVEMDNPHNMAQTNRLFSSSLQTDIGDQRNDSGTRVGHDSQSIE